MKYVWQILAVVNIIVVLAMLVCAYSVYLHPTLFPNWSWLGMVFPIPLLINITFAIFWLLVKRKYSLISVVGMVLCAGSIRTFYPINPFQGEPEGKTIKVLSYNVMGFSSDITAENPILQFILDTDADIVCLQEPSNLQSGPIYEHLKEAYPNIEICYDSTYCVAVLSKLPVIDSYPLDIKSSGNLSCAFNLLLDDDTLTVINNHLESYHLSNNDKENYGDLLHNLRHFHEEEDITEMKDLADSLKAKLAQANQVRAVQADSIDAFIQRCKSKYIISCGDFNDCSISYVHRVMSRHLNDTFTRAGNGMGISYNKDRMYFRIDNILVSENFTPYGTKVDDSVDKSDHYPIFCTLEY